MPRLNKVLSIVTLVSVGWISGCTGSSNSVEFPEKPVQMPAEDNEAAELDHEAESKT